MALPLDGIRVLDFTQVEFGPVCTQALGDFGADVIKVEREGSGDLSRWSLRDPAGPDNPVFVSLNRNKRSVALDIRAEASRRIIEEIARRSDVVVNNFRAGVMERLGLGYEDIRKLNPRIVYAVGSGYGPTGPYAHKGGQDVLAQALTGAMARRADPSQPLAIYGTALADYSAGMLLVQGILLALMARDRTGEGQKVEVSLYDALLSMQLQEATAWLMRGMDLNWAAQPLSGVFEAEDGPLVIVGAFKKNPLRDICAALELDDLSLLPEFADDAAQKAHEPELRRVFRDRIAQGPRERWLQRLERVDILCAPVLSIGEALESEQVAASQMVLRMDHPAGEVTTLANPVKLSGTPASVRRRPPQLGEHTREVLAELGLQLDPAVTARASETGS